MVYLLIILIFCPTSSLRICHGVITDNNNAACRATVNFYVTPDSNSIWGINRIIFTHNNTIAFSLILVSYNNVIFRIFSIILPDNCSVFSLGRITNTHNHSLTCIRLCSYISTVRFAINNVSMSIGGITLTINNVSFFINSTRLVYCKDNGSFFRIIFITLIRHCRTFITSLIIIDSGQARRTT